tara:strand:+ start:848 stop:1135 length:288 start_codon:yes stop_codon:yes gene_type:complete
MKNKFFYENGEYIENSIPVEALQDCYHQGCCDEDVSFWVKKLDFDFPVDMGKNWLKEFGAWNEKQLSDHGENKHRILWLLSGNFQDDQEILGLIH